MGFAVGPIRTGKTLKLQTLSQLKRMGGKSVTDTEPAARYLLFIISNKNYTPFFTSLEIDSLFKREILTYGENRYMPAGNNMLEKLEQLGDWKDLITNKLTPFLLLHYIVTNPKEISSDPQQRIEDIDGFMSSTRTIKIIEDFIFYHRKEIARKLPLGFLARRNS